MVLDALHLVDLVRRAPPLSAGDAGTGEKVGDRDEHLADVAVVEAEGALRAEQDMEVAVGGTAKRSVSCHSGYLPPWRSVWVHWRMRGSPETDATAYTSMWLNMFTSFRLLAETSVRPRRKRMCCSRIIRRRVAIQ